MQERGIAMAKFVMAAAKRRDKVKEQQESIDSQQPRWIPGSNKVNPVEDLAKKGRQAVFTDTMSTIKRIDSLVD